MDEINKRYKILVITEHIGLTAPGIVFETLLNELAKFADLTIITSNDDSAHITNHKYKFNIIQIKEPRFINARYDVHLNRLATRLFAISLKDFFLKIKRYNFYPEDYNAILSLCSAHCLAPMAIADRIKGSTNIPLITYLVDACPTPEWWQNKAKDSNGIKKYIYKYTRKVNLFLSSNPLMLKYQSNIVNEAIKEFSVIYPAVGTGNYNLKKRCEKIIFIYTGSIYGLRTTKYIFGAFEKFLAQYPDSHFVFIGTSKRIYNSCPKKIRPHVEVVDFSKDLKPYYEMATALIDIDANVQKDIFLSSKVTNYLLASRPIICETGEETPARKLFSGIQSIILCNHDSEQIYEAMKKAVENEFDYMDRKDVINLFNPLTSAKLLIDWIRTAN